MPSPRLGAVSILIAVVPASSLADPSCIEYGAGYQKLNQMYAGAIALELAVDGSTAYVTYREGQDPEYAHTLTRVYDMSVRNGGEHLSTIEVGCPSDCRALDAVLRGRPPQCLERVGGLVEPSAECLFLLGDPRDEPGDANGDARGERFDLVGCRGRQRDEGETFVSRCDGRCVIGDEESFGRDPSGAARRRVSVQTCRARARAVPGRPRGGSGGPRAA